MLRSVSFSVHILWQKYSSRAVLVRALHLHDSGTFRTLLTREPNLNVRRSSFRVLVSLVDFSCCFPKRSGFRCQQGLSYHGPCLQLRMLNLLHQISARANSPSLGALTTDDIAVSGPGLLQADVPPVPALTSARS